MGNKRAKTLTKEAVELASYEPTSRENAPRRAKSKVQNDRRKENPKRREKYSVDWYSAERDTHTPASTGNLYNPRTLTAHAANLTRHKNTASENARGSTPHIDYVKPYEIFISPQYPGPRRALSRVIRLRTGVRSIHQDWIRESLENRQNRTQNGTTQNRFQLSVTFANN
ncbi:hypothetical protein BD410DRAFT_809139 [Rickenella mellea]|uniref:Uncharacterized protein n=1 Tax=Rickenella mellea TaxID=50990 RepID=A0A4Y7PL39_9AGAM|nr:hypothetical protein BD410DRAFT_809139 [Rickenella mellea]